MAGLLDSLNFGNQGGYGGLLDMLMYPSPLNQKPEYSPYAGINTAFDTSAPQPQNPFGSVPQAATVPSSNAVFGSVPNLGPQAPMMPIPDFASVGYRPPQVAPPTSQQPMTDTERQMMGMVGVNSPPSAATPQAASAPQPAQSQIENPINVGGGYQMPRIGSALAFTPQTPTDVSAQSRAPQFQQMQATPAFMGGQQGAGIGDRLLTGVQNFANAGGPLQALAGGISGLATGNRSDAAGISQQNLKAQYEALVPLVGPQKAMLAILNPEAGKPIIDQAVGVKQKFTEIGANSDGTKQYGFVSERDQSVKPYSAPGGNEPISMQGPDGKIIQMPHGADPKTWRNEITRINADVAAGKKTEVQAKAEIFGNKMELANKSISDAEGTSLFGRIASGIPLGNYAQSPEYQRYKQASSNFITALLRQESGAAISKTEFDRYDREYMPQPGDSKEVLAQKAETRRVAIEGMKKGAGPAYKSPAESGGVRKYNPATGRIE